MTDMAGTELDGPELEWQVHGSERYELGEGVRLVGEDVVFVDILRGRLLSLSAGGGDEPHELAVLDAPLGAVAPRAGGGWIAAAGTGIAILDSRGRPTWTARPEDGAAEPMRMNDGVADASGRFWAGSMAYAGTAGAGTLYRIAPDGTVSAAVTGLTIPNGPAFDAAGTTMYLADSARGLIRCYDVDPHSGAVGEGKVFAKVQGGNPDGMTVDGEGYLWSAVWGAGQLRRYAPDGVLERIVPVPVTQPTSVCLTGRRIVVTSARLGLEQPGSADGALLSAPLAIPGGQACRAAAPDSDPGADVPG